MEQLILARHAESVFNVRGVLNGDPSIPGGLTERGREQSWRLGEALADQPIGLCVTTEFERTRETAEIALSGRDVPRLVISELNDPPNGDFELRPYAELVRWRQAHGPDEPVPGLKRTERDYFLDVARGFRQLAERPERTILAVLHGYVIAWITSSAGDAAPARHAEANSLDGAQLVAALDAVADDVFALYSWEMSGRPLLRASTTDD